MVRRVAVILNGQAGTLRRNPSLPHRISAAFQKAGFEVELLAVPADRLTDTAREAAARGVDVVVAGGGDGTVRSVAKGLVGGDVPLGVLPLGTLNHFARDLGMPPDLDAAIAALVAARPGRVDVGEVNGHLFVNNSSLGLYPSIVRERDRIGPHSRAGKWWATVRAAFRVLRRFPLHRVRIAAPGDEIATTTPVVFLGNNEYQTELFRLGTRSCIDAGKLQLYVPRVSSRFGLLRLFLRAFFGRLRQARDFVIRCAGEYVIETRKSTVRVAADGEVMELAPPLRYRILPAALPVLQPERGR